MSKKDSQFFNELGFFTISNAAPSLGKFFDEVITISTPQTVVEPYVNIQDKLKNHVFTTIQFNGGALGETYIFLEEKDAFKLADFALTKKGLITQSVTTWDELSVNAVEEIVNILGGNMTDVLTLILGDEVELDVPVLYTGEERPVNFDNDDEVLMNSSVLYLGEGSSIELHEVARKSYYENLIKVLKEKV